MTEKDIWLGGTVTGGLIGCAETGASITIRDSFAATVLRGESAAGGLIGEVRAADVNISRSYADSYIYAGETDGSAGGMLGVCDGNRLTMENSYAAGFLSGGVTAGLNAGSFSDTTVNNVYTACALLDENGIMDYTTLVLGQNATSVGNISRLYYFNEGIKTSAYDERVYYRDWSGKNRANAIATKLSGEFDDDTGDTNAYNLIDTLGLTLYSFPKLKNIPHYGDWQAEFESGSLVYYEKYGDGGYGFYGANVSSLRDDGALFGDGYAMAYEDDMPESVVVKWSGGSVELQKSSAVAVEVTVKGEKKTFYLMPLPAQLVQNVTDVPGFYREMSVDDRKHYYNPHFALTAVEGDEAPAAPGQVSVRTARQLNALSLYYDAYSPLLPSGAAFVQGRSIDYENYDWAGFGQDGRSVSSQLPIGRSADKAFRHSYNGGCHTISGVSFVSGADEDYAGMFGCTSGSLRDIVITTNRELENAPAAAISGIVQRRTAYLGILAGRNSGTIYNCAVSGYELSGRAYSGSVFHIGGLVGYNTGSIRASSVSCPKITAANTFAQLYVGGFAGFNSAQIRQCYAYGSIDIPDIRGGETVLAGFAADNYGTVTASFCATALSSAGGTTYGFVPNSGSVTGCFFLNEGTYSFADKISLYDFAAGSPGAQGVTREELETLRISGFSGVSAANTENYPNTPAGDGAAYPYISSITGADGAPVHYGDWVQEADLGTLGVVYWEKEVGDANGGYHFSYIGFENGEHMSGSSLCTAHDDGDKITDFGYAYYWKSSEAKPELTAEIEYGSFVLGERETSVEQELAKQTPGFSFVAYRTAEDAMHLESARSANGTWTLEQNGVSYGFRLCPFFANAYSYIEGASVSEPGIASAYEIRSVEQLQYINWSYYNNSGSTTLDVTAATYRSFPYLQYASVTSQAEQKLEGALAGDSIGGPRPIRSWKQTHDVNGNDMSEPGNPDKNTLVHPIAGSVNQGSDRNYNMILYSWFGGKYDGQNYYIKNIAINSGCYNVGLFGTTAGADIRNIVLYSDNGSVIQRSSRQSSWEYQNGGAPADVREYQCSYAVGGLVGIAYDYKADMGRSTIENCAIAGYIVEDNSKNMLTLGECATGGLVGVSSVSLVNCSAAVDIRINCTHRWKNDGSLNSARWGNYVRVGGLVGGLRFKATNCYTGGKITISEELLTESVLASDGTNTKLADGSEAVQIKWSRDRDSGGKNRNPATYVYIGGVGGSGFSANFMNFSNYNGGYDGYPQFENCYTYIDLPDMEGTITAITLIGSTADRYRYANATIRNCYYLKSTKDGVGFDNASRCITPKSSTASLANILSTQAERDKMLDGNLGYLTRYVWEPSVYSNNVNGLTELTYAQMDSRNGGVTINTANTNASQTYSDFRSALGSAFGWVSIDENGASIHGKYSFPGSDTALLGQNYPFPTVLTQTNSFGQEVSLHYGAWPKVGVFWEKGMDAVDMIADYDEKTKTSYITARLLPEQITAAELGGILPTFTCTNDGVVEATAAVNASGGYDVTLRGLRVGATEVTAELGEYTARLMLTVTAEMTVTVEPGMLELHTGDAAQTLRFRARDKNGDIISNVTWQIINSANNVASITEPKPLGEDYCTTVKALGAGESLLHIVAVCKAGDASYEGSAVVPVTVHAAGTTWSIGGAELTSLAEKPACSVMFDGIAVEPAVVTAEPGSVISWPDAPTRDGYKFIGWTTDGTHVWTEEDEYEPDGDVTFFALWRKAISIVVRPHWDTAWEQLYNVTEYGDGYVLKFDAQSYVTAENMRVYADGEPVLFSMQVEGWNSSASSNHYTVTIAREALPADEYLKE